MASSEAVPMELKIPYNLEEHRVTKPKKVSRRFFEALNSLEFFSASVLTSSFKSSASQLKRFTLSWKLDFAFSSSLLNSLTILL